MKSLIPSFFIFFFLVNITTAQTIVNSRSSVLQPGGYPISGNAFLEEFDNGTLQLRLDNDFSTTVGPDVRIFLSDDPISIRNGVEIADIGVARGGINHFQGAITFDVPSNVRIDQFDYIVFFCVDFGRHWASGNFGRTESNVEEEIPVAFECQRTVAATTNWTTAVTICENDGESDVIPLFNTLMIPAGDNYAYIITDENNQIEKVLFEDSYNFEGTGVGINRVFGISYDGTLNYTIGRPLTTITAEGCAILSSNAIFLTVTKEDCTPAFECQETIAATTNWATEITICENDGVADSIPLLNTLMISAGDNYAYIITDENNQIEKVIFEDSYDFDSTGVGINRVFGISYDDTLNYTIGSPLTTIIAEGCAILSDTTIFLTVTKVDCDASTEEEEEIVEDIDLDGFTDAEDCDDNNAQVNPNQTEIPYNGIDDDCNAATLDDDLDQDGFGITDDCDDRNSDIYPGASEVLDNGVDEDCNGQDDTAEVDNEEQDEQIEEEENQDEQTEAEDETLTIGNCVPISGILTTTSISDNNAYIYTPQPNGEIDNQFRYRPNGSTTWELTDISTLYFRYLSDLLPGTEYEFQVNQACGDGTFSEFSASTFFTTTGVAQDGGRNSNDTANKTVSSFQSTDATKPIAYSVFQQLSMPKATTIQVAPNPVFNELVFNIEQASPADAILRIYSISGQLTKELALEQAVVKTTIDVSNLESGLYLLEYRTSELRKTTKFVKR